MQITGINLYITRFTICNKALEMKYEPLISDLPRCSYTVKYVGHTSTEKRSKQDMSRI